MALFIYISKKNPTLNIQITKLSIREYESQPKENLITSSRRKI
jgi:hypothetical protein